MSPSNLDAERRSLEGGEISFMFKVRACHDGDTLRMAGDCYLLWQISKIYKSLISLMTWHIETQGWQVLSFTSFSTIQDDGSGGEAEVMVVCLHSIFKLRIYKLTVQMANMCWTNKLFISMQIKTETILANTLHTFCFSAKMGKCYHGNA